MGDADIYSVVSDISLGGMTAKHTDSEDHNTNKLHNQSHSNDSPEYNTLQHGNAANIQIGHRNSMLDKHYDKIDVHTSKGDLRIREHLQLAKQFQAEARHEYDDVELSAQSQLNFRKSQTTGDYEPVHHDPNCIQIDKSNGNHIASQKAATTTVIEKTSTAKKEVEYAEPLTPKHHTLDVHTKGEHFYHSLELNEPTKHISSASYLKESSKPVVESTFGSNKDYISEAKSPESAMLPMKNQVRADAKCQIHTFTSLYDDSCSDHNITVDETGTGATNAPILFNLEQCEFDDPMYEGVLKHTNPSLKKMDDSNSNIIILSPEKVPCIGDMSGDPDLLNHEEDTNTPGYSDPTIPGCLDDTDLAESPERTTVNIYNKFDDSKP